MGFNTYIIEDDYFKAQLMKKRISSVFFDTSIQIFKCNEWLTCSKDEGAQANELFLISSNSNSYHKWLEIAKSVREKNWLAQIIIYGEPLKIDYQLTINLVSPIGVLDLTSPDSESEIVLLIRKAKVVMDSILKSEDIVEIKLKSKVLHYNSNEINYIATVKGERNKTEIHTQEGIDCVSKPIKEIKKISFPDSFYTDLRSYIINVQEIQSVSHSESALIFFNGEMLYVGIKVRKKIIDFMKENSPIEV